MRARILTACVVSCLVGGVLSAQPTANEQAMIYELNRARANPQRYAAEQSLGTLLDGIIARPPLAVNNDLVSSARFKSEEMATNNYFAHQSAVTGDWPNKIARDHGYPLHTSLSDTANNIESLAAGYSNVFTALAGLIEDQGVSPPGHRYHLLATGPSASFYAQFREVGVGYAFNASATYQRYYSIHTGYRNSDFPFITGVVYNDTNGNGRYDQGEGLSGVTITATGPSTLQATSNAQGGWTIAASTGTWNLSCSGGAFAGTATATANVSSDNIEVDFASGRSVGEVDFEFQAVGGGRIVNATPTFLGFTSPATGVASASQSITVSGMRLTGNVDIVAPAEFQVSLSSGSGFAGSLSLTPTAGTLAATTVYVRFLPTGASGASGEVTLDSPSALGLAVSVNGAVSTSPVIFASPSTLNLTATRIGEPSSPQSYTVSGYNLTGNLTVTAPTDFEVSVTSGSGYATSLNLTPASGTVSPTTIYVRFVPVALTGSGTVMNASTGAGTQSITVNGNVANAPNISVNPTALTMVSQTVGDPSNEQTFTVSGLYLAGDIQLTAPTGFDFSLTSGSGYVTALNLTPGSGEVAATTIYVRYLGGAGGNTGNLTCTSNLATTRQVALTGLIAPPPNLFVNASGLSFTSTAPGTPSSQQQYAISGSNLISNVTVTAPFGFQVSTTSGTGFAGSVVLTPTAGTLTLTTIYIRYSPVTSTALAGHVTHEATGATTRVLAVSGSIGSAPPPDDGGSSGGGGCRSSNSGAAWLLLSLPALALIARRRRLRALS